VTRNSTDPQARAHRNNCRHLVACPFCGAEAGQKCIGMKGQPRYASHVERWQLFDPAYVAAHAQRKIGPKQPRAPRQRAFAAPAAEDEFEVMGN
jgi:hypothetical protein